MKCSICNTTCAESYYKNKDTNEIICNTCLLESDLISYDTVTSYYLEGEYLGDTNDYEQLLENVACQLNYEEVNENHFNLIARLQRKNEEKDKQIEELVKYIDSNNCVTSNSCDFQDDFKIEKCIDEGNCKDCIRKYFEEQTKN